MRVSPSSCPRPRSFPMAPAPARQVDPDRTLKEKTRELKSGSGLEDPKLGRAAVEYLMKRLVVSSGTVRLPPWFRRGGPGDISAEDEAAADEAAAATAVTAAAAAAEESCDGDAEAEGEVSAGGGVAADSASGLAGSGSGEEEAADGVGLWEEQAFPTSSSAVVFSCPAQCCQSMSASAFLVSSATSRSSELIASSRVSAATTASRSASVS